MRIYILPVSEYLQPETQGFIWPPGCDDYGVEQDMLYWLQGEGPITNDPDDADWHYLPVFYNRWFWQHPDERDGGGRFNDEIQESLLDRNRTFTVCEYGILLEQPDVNLDGVTIFTASRRGESRGIDIPLLLHAHDLHTHVRKKWLASFAGNYVNDGARLRAHEILEGRPDVYFSDEFLDINDFVRLLQASHIALAPRGKGIASFRFYEAMQAGTVPLLISDIDGRPFKEWIDWDTCSLYRPDAEGLSEYLDSFSLQELDNLGKEAQRVWYDDLQYGRWCRFVLKHLEKMG